MTKAIDLSGEWQSYYRYPSSSRGNDAMWGRHVLIATQQGVHFTFKTTPDNASQIVLEIDVNTTGTEASGSWRERTEPEGYYKGAVYTGTVQFKISPDGKRLDGIWQGDGSNGEANSDIWELVRVAAEGSDV